MRTACATFVALAAMAAAAGLAQDKPSTKPLTAPASTPSTRPAVKIIISKETTYLTGPLRPDGTVDYVKAWKEILSKDVTPDNNAVIPLVKALGPDALPEKNRAEILAELGLKDLPKDGDYLVEPEEYARLHPPAEVSGETGLPGSSLGRAILAATSRPWGEKDLPELAAYMKDSQKHLDMVVQASKLPKFYVPVATGAGATMADQLEYRLAAKLRAPSRLLVRRALMRFEAGDVAGAADDLLAVHPLARLYANARPLLADHLLALWIDDIASEGDVAIATSGKLTAKQATDYMAKLQGLPPVGDLPHITDVGERIFGLDVLLNFRQGRPMVDIPPSVELPYETPRPFPTMLARTDWNQVLRQQNVCQDLLVTQVRGPLTPEGKAAAAKAEELVKAAKNDPTLAKMKATIKGLREKGATRDAILQAVDAEISRLSDRQMTELAVTYLVWDDSSMSDLFGLDCSWTNHLIRVCAQRQMKAALSPVTLAMAAYKVDKGKYPAALAALVPAYIKELPKDVFTGKDLLYKARERGYIIYSVGPNQKDDDGEGSGATVSVPGKPDDIAVKAEE